MQISICCHLGTQMVTYRGVDKCSEYCPHCFCLKEEASVLKAAAVAYFLFFTNCLQRIDPCCDDKKTEIIRQKLAR